jgi:putative toxin-antitoxin system antitoxin component (TIGR02293 family)
MAKKKIVEEIKEENMVCESTVEYVRSTPSHQFNTYANAQVRALTLLNVNHGSINRDSDFIQLIRDGISKKSLDYLITQIGYTLTDIALLLHVSDRNLRRYTPSEKLNTEQSERLIELAKLYAKGEEVFGNMNEFNEWMNSDIIALGGIKPKSLLDTSLGIQLLFKELGKIEHGVFA